MTVDSSQGQEADLVIISMVRCNPTGRVGFTNDARRLNVAIARARAGVVIIGHLPTSRAASMTAGVDGTPGISPWDAGVHNVHSWALLIVLVTSIAIGRRERDSVEATED